MMKSVLVTSAIVSFVLLLGRLSGFVRETLLAATLGPTEVADGAIVILTLPDLMVGLLLTGGFNAALIPAIKQAEHKQRIILVRKAVLFFGSAFAGLGFVLGLSPNMVIGLLAPELHPATQPSYLTAFRLSLIALPLVALVGIAAGYLNSIGRFEISSLSVLLFNIVLCVYLVSLHAKDANLTGFAIAIITASAVRLGIHLVFMKPVLSSIAHMPSDSERSSLDRKLLWRFVCGVLGFSLIVAAPVVFRTFFASLQDGNLALFNFALKLFELPAALMIAPVVIVMLPKLAGLSQAPEDRVDYNRTAATAIIAAFTLATVAAAITIVFATPIARAVFLHGLMDPASVDRIGNLTRILVLGLPALAVLQLCAAGLNARGQVSAVLLWGAVALGLAIFSTAALMRLPLPDDFPVPAIGLGIFNVFGAIFYLVALFGLGSPSGALRLTLIRIVAGTAVGILPFVAIMALWGNELGRWGGTTLSLTALPLLLWINWSAIRPLLRIRIDDK